MAKKRTFIERFTAELERNKIDSTYANWGSSSFPQMDAFANQANLTHIPAVTERSGGAAALGGTLISGKPGILTVSQAPGWYAGMGDTVNMAARYHVSFIGIVGQPNNVFSGSLYGFQQCYDLETSVGAMAPYLKVTDDTCPEELARKAISLSYSGVGGPVVIDMPMDQSLRRDAPEAREQENVLRPSLSLDDKKELETISQHSGNILFILGRGYAENARGNAGLRQQLDTIVEKNGIGVATDSTSIGEFDSEHPNYIGMAGRLKPTPVAKRMSQFSLRVLLGAEPDAVLTNENLAFPDREPNWSSERFIMIHPDAKVVGHYQDLYPETMIGIVAEVSDAVNFLSTLNFCPSFSRKHTIKTLHNETKSMVSIYPELDVETIAEIVNEVTSGKRAVHVFDGGITANSMSYNIRGAGPGSMVVPQHAVGTAQNFASGIAFELTKKGQNTPVIAHIGDGAAHYGLNQIATIKGTITVPLITIVYNNYIQMAVCHGAQQRGHSVNGALIGADLPEKDFTLEAKSLNIQSARVSDTDPEAVKNALLEAINSYKPTIIQIDMTTKHAIRDNAPAEKRRPSPQRACVLNQPPRQL